MTVKQFLEIIKYKINDGGEFCWDCYGKKAFMLDSFRTNGHIGMVFDTKDQTVYELRISDYKENKAYKWINPKYKQKHDKELKKRGFKTDQAWDDVNYEDVSIQKLIPIAKKASSKK